MLLLSSEVSLLFFLFFGILCGSGGKAKLSRSRSLYSSSVMLTHQDGNGCWEDMFLGSFFLFLLAMKVVTVKDIVFCNFNCNKCIMLNNIVTEYNWWVVCGLGFYAATRFACAGAVKLLRRLRPNVISDFLSKMDR